MKILLTGASGLLGTDIALALEKNNISTHKVCAKERPGFISADLRNPEDLEKLKKMDWDAVIHTAAARDPDICEKDRDGAYRLNVLSAKFLAEAAAARNAKMIFISTDYVFPGTNPPYRETDTPSPINYYGQTKCEAEKFIAETVRNHCIIRVPILYGFNAGPEAAALLYSSVKAIKNGKEVFIDNFIVRYPTFTEDVAETILFLLKKDLPGIFHYSGQDRLTKYEITKLIAEIFGKNADHIKPLDTEPVTAAKRPRDSHLDCGKILSLGCRKPDAFGRNMLLHRNAFGRNDPKEQE